MEAGQVCASKRLIHHRYLPGRLCARVQASGHPQRPNFLAHGSRFPDSVLFPCELQLGHSGLKGHPRQPSLPRIVERTLESPLCIRVHTIQVFFCSIKHCFF